MEEQKKISFILVLCTIFSFILSVVIEVWPSNYVFLEFLRGHRNFCLSISLGIFTGTLVSGAVSWIMYKHQKEKAVLNLANDLIALKKCVTEIKTQRQNFCDGIKQMQGICRKIMETPEILELEREIDIEKDFVDKIKDISRGYSSEQDFLEKYELIVEYIDYYCVLFLKRCHLQTKDFEYILKVYDSSSLDG